MKQYFSVLRKCSLFDRIEDKDLFALLGCLQAKVRSFQKKEPIFSEGAPAKEIGIVLYGSAQIVQIDFWGNRSIVSGIGPSELFGEAFACAEVPLVPVSIVANSDCEILLIDCQRILHSCSAACHFHQQMIFNLMKDLALKNILFHQKIEITAKRTTREKLMAYLALQEKIAGNRCFEIPFNRQELADYLQVERSGLSAEISKLRQSGILRCRKNRFELLE